MKSLFLKRLKINNKVINFNSGMNYIIGYNGSGKTTIFSLILYLMGLKKINRTINFINQRNLDLELEMDFEGQSLYFRRNLQDEIIVEGVINQKINLSEIDSFYSELLAPQFNIGNDETAAAQILRSSFYSETEIHSNIEKENIKKKIMGINVSYLKESKKQIELFKSNLKIDEYSYEILKTYITNVEKNINELENSEQFKGILKEEFFKMYDEIYKNKKVLDQAMEAYSHIRDRSEMIFSERDLLLRDILNDNLGNLGFKDNLNSRNHSGSERRTVEFLNILIGIIKHTGYSFLNSSGLLVADCPFGYVDFNNIKGIRNFIDQETRLQKLQYVEFCNNDDNIPTDWIVFDLRDKGALIW